LGGEGSQTGKEKIKQIKKRKITEKNHPQAIHKTEDGKRFGKKTLVAAKKKKTPGKMEGSMW